MSLWITALQRDKYGNTNFIEFDGSESKCRLKVDANEIFIHNADVTFEWNGSYGNAANKVFFIEIIVRDQLESDDDKLIHFPYGSTG